MNNRRWITVGALMAGLALAGCGSSSTSSTTTSSRPPSSTAAPAATNAPAVSTTTTTAASSTSAATCPTLAQANAALGATYSGPISTSLAGGGLECEYTNSSGNGGVTIFAHQSADVFAGQVAHAPGNPAMPSISGVGDGAYGMMTGGRSVVNAYSNASRTLVAAAAPATLAQVEALARVALSVN